MSSSRAIPPAELAELKVVSLGSPTGSKPSSSQSSGAAVSGICSTAYPCPISPAETHTAESSGKQSDSEANTNIKAVISKCHGTNSGSEGTCGRIDLGFGAQSTRQSPKEIAEQREELSVDPKAHARQVRNRESAAQSRIRKKKYVEEMEFRCQQLEHANGQLNAMVQQLTAENAALKCQLANAYSGQTSAVQTMMPYAGGIAYVLQPQAAPNPKIPIPASRPVVKRRQSSSDATKGKKAKAGAATSAVLLSVVCCLFLVSGPWTRTRYMPHSWTGALPDTKQALGRSGRVLTAIGMTRDEAGSDERGGIAALPSSSDQAHSGTELHDKPRAREGKIPSEPGSSNAKSHALAALDQGCIDAEVMQQLKKLGPLALSSGRWLASRRMDRARRDFPMLAGNIFGDAGLMSPVMCTEVMRFHRADQEQAKDEHQESSRHQHYRGRTSSAIPLPPVREQWEDTQQQDHDGPSQRIGLDGYAEDEVGTIVSVLFPSRNVTGSPEYPDSEHQKLEQLYVVILEPQSIFVTYRCELPYIVEMKS